MEKIQNKQESVQQNAVLNLLFRTVISHLTGGILSDNYNPGNIMRERIWTSLISFHLLPISMLILQNYSVSFGRSLEIRKEKK